MWLLSPPFPFPCRQYPSRFLFSFTIDYLRLSGVPAQLTPRSLYLGWCEKWAPVSSHLAGRSWPDVARVPDKQVTGRSSTKIGGWRTASDEVRTAATLPWPILAFPLPSTLLCLLLSSFFFFLGCVFPHCLEHSLPIPSLFLLSYPASPSLSVWVLFVGLEKRLAAPWTLDLSPPWANALATSPPLSSLFFFSRPSPLGHLPQHHPRLLCNTTTFSFDSSPTWLARYLL